MQEIKKNFLYGALDVRRKKFICSLQYKKILLLWTILLINICLIKHHEIIKDHNDKNLDTHFGLYPNSLRNRHESVTSPTAVEDLGRD